MLHGHDCSHCIYLGSDKNTDYYYCPKAHGGGTLIARYGEAGEYSSGLDFCFSSPYINHALRLACKKLSDKDLIRVLELQDKVKERFIKFPSHKYCTDQYFDEEGFTQFFIPL